MPWKDSPRAVKSDTSNQPNSLMTSREPTGKIPLFVCPEWSLGSHTREDVSVIAGSPRWRMASPHLPFLEPGLPYSSFPRCSIETVRTAWSRQVLEPVFGECSTEIHCVACLLFILYSESSEMSCKFLKTYLCLCQYFPNETGTLEEALR